MIRNDMRVTEFMKKFKQETDFLLLKNSKSGNSKKQPSSSRKSTILKPLEIEQPTPLSHLKLKQFSSAVDKSAFSKDDQHSINRMPPEDFDFFISAADEDKKKRTVSPLSKSPFQIINEVVKGTIYPLPPPPTPSTYLPSPST